MQVQDKYIIRNLEMEKCKMVILLWQKFFLKIKDTKENVEEEMEDQQSPSLLLNSARVALNANYIMDM